LVNNYRGIIVEKPSSRNDLIIALLSAADAKDPYYTVERARA
jgi:hypothetical protein